MAGVKSVCTDEAASAEKPEGEVESHPGGLEKEWVGEEESRKGRKGGKEGA